MTVHERFEFHMPASCEVVFDVFHYHEWRQRWDSLVRATHVLNGAPCPYVGALSSNAGGGLLSGLSMHTRFISYVRPQLAAAKMEGRSFPFARWAASMRHRPLSDGESVMIYTYSFDVAPPWLRWAFEPVVKLIFDWQTRKRFGRMQRFLRVHADEVQRWQRSAMPG